MNPDDLIPAAIYASSKTHEDALPLVANDVMISLAAFLYSKNRSRELTRDLLHKAMIDAIETVNRMTPPDQ